MKKICRRLADWTHWPFIVFYFPLFFLWGWYCLRSRAVWFFSASNPTISFGGFEGESKSEMYAQLPERLYPETLLVQPGTDVCQLLQQVRQRFRFPFVVKPDVGMKGILFRKIETEAQLLQYHQSMPAPYLVQAYVDLPQEVSVFYCRAAHEPQGTITAVIQKDLLQVSGDGVSSVAQLLMQIPDAADVLPEIKKQQGSRLQQVPHKGETFYLSFVGNRMHGATFINLTHQVDAALRQVFDEISRQMQFCYGRYDIKCASVDSIRQGTDFSILEFNGAGSIPNHIYTGSFTLLHAWREVASHWQALYRISKSHHLQGVPYWTLGEGLRFLRKSKKHFSRLKQVDQQLVF